MYKLSRVHRGRWYVNEKEKVLYYDLGHAPLDLDDVKCDELSPNMNYSKERTTLFLFESKLPWETILNFFG